MGLTFEAEGWPEGLPISLKPLRRVIGRSSVICNGWHRTTKHPMGYLPGESEIELIVLMFAEMDPNVTKIAAQPVKIITDDQNGNIFGHFPDYAMIIADAGVIVEAKPDKQAAKPKIISRLRSAAAHAEWCGYDYRLALRNEMVSDPRYGSIEAVWRYSSEEISSLLIRAVSSILRHNPSTIGDLISSISKISGLHDTTYEQVLAIIANGHAFFDYDCEIGLDAKVRFPDRRALPSSLIPNRRPSDPVGEEWAS